MLSLDRVERRQFSSETFVSVRYPEGGYELPGVVLCSDGELRHLSWVGATPDLSFRIPATVVVEGEEVNGYITPEYEGEYHHPSGIVALGFRAYDLGRTAYLLAN